VRFAVGRWRQAGGRVQTATFSCGVHSSAATCRRVVIRLNGDPNPSTGNAYGQGGSASGMPARMPRLEVQNTQAYKTCGSRVVWCAPGHARYARVHTFSQGKFCRCEVVQRARWWA